MPEFAPGEAKTAVAPITVKPSGLSCGAEIFLGPDDMTKIVTSGMIAFTSTGARQDVRLPVAMPAAEGDYHVYIDIYTEGILIAAYQAIEDVVIAGIAEFEYVSPIRLTPWQDVYRWEIDIKNISGTASECTVTLYQRTWDSRAPGWSRWREFTHERYPQLYDVYTAVIEPGQIIRFSGICSRGGTWTTHQYMIKSEAGTILEPPEPKEFICSYCWELYEKVVSFATEEELDNHITLEHPEYAPMEPLTHFFVKGVKWAGSIDDEGYPTSWYCKVCGTIDPEPFNGETYRGLDEPCEFTSGWKDSYNGIPNVVLCIEVYYVSSKGYGGWMCDSPIIYRIPDGGTVTFETVSPRGCRNWQVIP